MCIRDRKYEEEISATYIETPKPKPYLKIIPPSRPSQTGLKHILRRLRGELTNLKVNQAKIKKTFVDLKGVYKDFA